MNKEVLICNIMYIHASANKKADFTTKLTATHLIVINVDD